MTKEIPSPGELLRRYGLGPRKSWGQNFLNSVPTLISICDALGLEKEEPVVEIGAGLGALTMHLLAREARVWAIERDRDLCEVLRKELGDNPRFQLREADAVRFDYAGLAKEVGHRLPVAGNLPYQLTGALIFALLEAHEQTGTWVVMVQREVADRFRAEPGSRQYGGPSVILSRLRRIDSVCAVSRGCFLPPPRVDSMVIRLDPLDKPRGEVGDPKAFAHLVRSAFQKRRKSLLNALGGLAPREEVRAWIEAVGVDPGIRPERLGPEEFAALQRAREASDA